MSEPIPVEAIQYDGSDSAAIAAFTGLAVTQMRAPGGLTGPGFTCDGTLYVLAPGDWVVRTGAGSYVACTAVLFAGTYTAV